MFDHLFCSSIIVGINFFEVLVASIMIIVIPSVVIANDSPVFGVLFGIGLFLIIGLLTALWFSRWGFYIAAVFYKKSFPEIGYSWSMTKKHTWRIFVLFLIIGLITSIISGAISGLFGAILGNSVLFSIITSLVTILTYMISAVAYAVMYFDLEFRHGGAELQDMIDDYPNNRMGEWNGAR